MKYAIKIEGTSEYIEKGSDNFFSIRATVDYATKFDSIADAIVAIEKRTDATIQSWRNPMRLTIVGVKEINQPRYEEVAL